jgi:hypothetical protein
MKYTIVVLLIAGASFLLWHNLPAATDQPIQQCRADVETWRVQLIEHVNQVSDTKSQQFSTDAGQVDTSEWLTRQERIGDCLSIDRHNDKAYEYVSRRIDSMLSTRFLGFLLATQQGPQYAEWEQQEQQEQNGK